MCRSWRAHRAWQPISAATRATGLLRPRKRWSEGFRRQVLDFAERKATPIIRFEKGMRKDDVMHKRLRKFKAREGVVFIGIAQEKARVPRTIRKGFGEGEGTIPWIDYTTAMVNHYYFYCVDEDFGPLLSMKRRSRDFSASGSQYCRTPIPA